MTRRAGQGPPARRAPPTVEARPPTAAWHWQRHVLGTLALLLLAAGGLYAVVSDADPTQSPYLAACWRMGVVFAALWLALPQLAGLRLFRNRLWFAGVLALVIVLWRWPRLLPAALLGLVVLALLRPRRPQRGPGSPVEPRGAS